MLTHYFELRTIPQIELTDVDVMNHLMQTVHQTLANYDGKVGISFPAYGKKYSSPLGGIIRFFADSATLDALEQDLKFSSTINDYAIIMPKTAIPEHVKGYLCVSRVRQKGASALRRAERRLTEQGKWSKQIRDNMLNKWGSKTLAQYPHCHLTSSSTGQSFILWINQRTCSSSQLGLFNSYGLSQQATVPDF